MWKCRLIVILACPVTSATRRGENPSYEQMTRADNGKKDSEQAGMTSYCVDTLCLNIFQTLNGVNE
jgi:hypothetical protein